MKLTPEADPVLQELKAYLSSVPSLVAPKPEEPLLLCLAATNKVVSVALVAYTTGISLFAVCPLFVVRLLTAKKVFAVSHKKTDGKDVADGKRSLCHQPVLCRPLADGKESLPSASRRQRGGWVQLLFNQLKPTGPTSLPSASGRQTNFADRWLTAKRRVR